MAQAMASMAVLEGSLQLISGSTRLNVAGSNGRMGVSPRPGNLTVIRAQQQMGEQEITSRRSMLGLVAGGLAAGSFVQTVFAEAIPIKVGPPPPPSGGLPGTENSDEARDLDLNLKNRFYLQALPPTAAAARAKESAKEIVGVKKLIEKKAWPYVQNDLRLRASYLRFDLNTIIASKPKDEKKTLKELTGKLFDNISALDHAAKVKSSSDAEKSYASTVSALDEVIAKLG